MSRETSPTETPNIEWGYAIETRGETPGLVKQVHGARCVSINDVSQRDRLLAAPPDADGVATVVSGIELYVFTADCLPVLLHGEGPASPLAALHCGWRGALGGIISAAVKEHFRPGENIHALFGPALLACCFEVKADFIRGFEEKEKPILDFIERRQGKMFCHLDRYVEEVELNRAGNVTVDRSRLRCTYCSSPALPSYRRLGNTDRRLRTWIRR